jgi:hypothetical protein
MQTVNITAYTEDASQIEAIKAVMKALKIKFEIAKEKPYDPDFVSKIERSRQDNLQGKGVTITLDELKKLWT